MKISIDIDKLLEEEELDLKNEMYAIFKKLQGGYEDYLKVYEKFEKPLEQIIENLKEYARATEENQQDSPFFELAKQYETLIDGQKQLAHDLYDDVVLVMQNIVSKSQLLNDTIKELNSAAKHARKLKAKIAKIEAYIEELHAKGKPEKVPKKEAEKQQKEAEFNLAKDKLASAKEKYDNMLLDFNQEKDELLKKALSDLADADKKYIEVINGVLGKIEEAAGKL
ncbi:MAG: hypothetical protein ACTSO9_06885 [Candidatus Helarchaeota archaeon]